MEKIPDEITLGHLLVQLSRLVGIRMRYKLERLGLQRAQGMILVQLWHADGMAQNELARALRIRPATVTSTLQRMERDGWVTRRRGERDQRTVRVYLTGKAAALREDVHHCLRELDDDLTSALTPKERELLRQSLLKVRRHLLADIQSVPESRAGSKHGLGANRRGGM